PDILVDLGCQTVISRAFAGVLVAIVEPDDPVILNVVVDRKRGDSGERSVLRWLEDSKDDPVHRQRGCQQKCLGSIDWLARCEFVGLAAHEHNKAHQESQEHKRLKPPEHAGLSREWYSFLGGDSVAEEMNKRVRQPQQQKRPIHQIVELSKVVILLLVQDHE